MGMDADVIGIGKYSNKIVDCLCYSPDFYLDTKEGAEIITTVFHACTSDSSHQLARAMGVEPWDFNTHKIDIGNVQMTELLEFIKYSPDHDLDDIEDFFDLEQAGFVFFFRPNG